MAIGPPAYHIGMHFCGNFGALSKLHPARRVKLRLAYWPAFVIKKLTVSFLSLWAPAKGGKKVWSGKFKEVSQSSWMHHTKLITLDLLPQAQDPKEWKKKCVATEWHVDLASYVHSESEGPVKRWIGRENSEVKVIFARCNDAKKALQMHKIHILNHTYLIALSHQLF